MSAPIAGFEHSRHSRARCVTRVIFALLSAVTLLLTWLMFVPGSAASHAAQPAAPMLTNVTGGTCDVGVNDAQPRTRQINLVLDDSGSMFENSNTSWSGAKYSVEVFAAMLGVNDTLNVFLTSDFTEGGSGSARAQVRGSASISDRVKAIHDMPLAGGGTPYAPVSAALGGLQSSQADEKWLVVLSDGEFDGVPSSQVQADLEAHIAATADLRVAFLALGSNAPSLSSTDRMRFEAIRSSSEILNAMNEFSNLIFGRNSLETGGSGRAFADIDIFMDEVMVFAQGEGVSIGDLDTSEGTKRANSSVAVSWAANSDARSGGMPVSAVPDSTLQGEIAVFENVPPGSISAEISGAKSVVFFYKPRVVFGVELMNAQGEVVDSTKLVGGEYTVTYGFMDENCAVIDSVLFGEPKFTANVTHRANEADGESVVIAESLASGSKITLEQGFVSMDVRAEFLKGSTSQTVIDVHVLRPPKPTLFEVERAGDFEASKLEDYELPTDAMELRYALDENGRAVDFSAEEWATFTPDSFTVTSSEPDVEFAVQIGRQPGQVFVLPLAPGGDRFKAATGEIPLSIAASHIYDEQLNEGTFVTQITIENDISMFERFVNWFLATGWKFLLLLIVLAWVLGYFIRRRLPRQLKAKPLVDFRPRSLGGKRTQFHARYEKSRGRQLIPYAAETGVIRPPAQVRGLAPLRVKALGSGRMEVLNWKAIAASGKVSFDGEQLTKETKKVRPLRGTSTITVAANDGNYDIQLSQTATPTRR